MPVDNTKSVEENTMDINNYGGWIVFLDGEYLVAVAYEDTKYCRWSNSPYSAAFFTDVNDAINVARRVGGQIRRFNPIKGVVT